MVQDSGEWRFENGKSSDHDGMLEVLYGLYF